MDIQAIRDSKINGFFFTHIKYISRVTINNLIHQHVFQTRLSFTFNIAKGINDKEGGNYRIYISVTQKGLPQLGEKYYFKEHIDNNGPFDFEDECYIASIEVTPYLYQCSDIPSVTDALYEACGTRLLVTSVSKLNRPKISPS